MVPYRVTNPDLFGGLRTSPSPPLCTVGAVPGPELPSDLDGCHALAIPAGEGATSAGVRGHLFSPDAQAWVDSTSKEWQAWLEGLGA